VLALFDFGYSLWFEVLGIDLFIQKIWPLNKFRDGFEQLSKAEYVELFHQINRAIHFEPDALKNITYSHKVASGEIIQSTLLRNAEILHLQDVARLLLYGQYCLAIFSIALIATGILGTRKILNSFSIFRSIGSLWCTLACIVFIIFLTKPVQIFYWVHEFIFPKNSQWFFFYQDSLMTTLMKAPDLFGPITIAIIVLCIIFHYIYALAFKKSLALFTRPPHSK
jgi:hypothetical protein